MGYRVIIENLGDPDDENNNTSARAEFTDPSPIVDAERLGNLIGYAINSLASFVIPNGSIIDGIIETLNDKWLEGFSGSRTWTQEMLDDAKEEGLKKYKLFCED